MEVIRMQIMLQLTHCHITWIKPNKIVESFIFDFVVLFLDDFRFLLMMFLHDQRDWCNMSQVTWISQCYLDTATFIRHVSPVREPRHNWDWYHVREITQESEHLSQDKAPVSATQCGPWCLVPAHPSSDCPDHHSPHSYFHTTYDGVM